MAPPMSLSPFSWEVLPSRMPWRELPFACNLSLQNENKIVLVGPWNSQPYIFDVDTQTWTQLLRIETHSATGMICLGNTIFLTGTVRRNHENFLQSITLDQEGNPDHQQRWQSLPSTSPRRFDCAIVAVEGNIVIIGGFNIQSSLPTVEKFNAINRTWTSLPNMTEPRAGCATAAVGSKVYVFGGANNQSIAKNTAEYLDIHAGTWQSLPTMPCCRKGVATVVVGEFIILIGGMDENGNILGSVDCFNTVTHQWIQDALPPLRVPRWLCAAVTVKGEVFVFGGKNGVEFLDSVERIKILPFYVLVPKLQNLFNQEDLPLGLWPHILSKCPLNVVFRTLLSDRFHLDSVLQHQPKEKKSGKKKEIRE